jgi:acetyl esterase/lipase
MRAKIQSLPLLLFVTLGFGIFSLKAIAEVKLSTLAYGPDKAQVLDLHTPTSPPTTPMATVLLAHGGLWHSGGRDALTSLCTNIVERSKNTIACASIDYRLSQDLGGSCEGTGKGTYVEQLGDMARAFALLQSEAGSYSLDPRRMHIGGHSAGAHLAQLLNLRWQEFSPSCKHPEGCPVAIGAIGFEGIYDIPAWNAYDESFWDGQFNCATRKAFGAAGDTPEACREDGSDKRCWDMGSPAYIARNAKSLGHSPVADVLLIHSPGDNWVDMAETTQYGKTLSTAFPNIEVITKTDGSCASGQHNDVLKQTELADCIINFVATRASP